MLKNKRVGKCPLILRMGVIDDGVVTISVDFMIHCVVNEKVENGNRDHKLLF